MGRIMALGILLLEWSSRYGGSGWRGLTQVWNRVMTILRRILSWILILAQWIGRNNGIVTAVGTVALAIITYVYVMEVQEQNRFNYIMFDIQNKPEVEILGLTPFEVGDVIRTSAGIKNNGGVVEHVRVGIALLCCISIEEIKEDNINTILILPYGLYANRLSRGRDRVRYMGITGENHRKFEIALRESNQSVVSGYVRVDYISPANAIRESTEYSDSMSFWWNPRFSRWMEFSLGGHRIVEGVLKSRGILDELDKLKGTKQK